MEEVYGIDLGTCYSCIAVSDENGNIRVNNNQQGNYTTPSIVSFQKDGTPVVGQTAKNQMAVRAKESIAFVKREMSEEYCKKTIKIGEVERKVSPVEISACILYEIISAANKERENTDRKPSLSKAVITIPATFSDSEREKTKEAAIYAGIEVLGLIQEPTAAAIAYNIEDGETIVVYDLGGGTLDVSVVKRQKNEYNVLATYGNPQLGGKDWDERLIEFALEKHGVNTNKYDREGKEWADLLMQAENCKKNLTDSFDAIFTFNKEGIMEMAEITQKEFESFTEDLVEKTLSIVDRVLLEAKKPKVDRFVLVGGSSRMPMIKEAVQQKYNVKTVVSDPDQSIAKGAAIYASNLVNGGDNIFFINDKGGYSYGFKCFEDSVSDKEVVLNKILRSDPLYIKEKKFRLFVRNNNQTGVQTQIVENKRLEKEFPYKKENKNEKIILEQVLKIPPETPIDTPINYRLSRDMNGIIKITVECQGNDLSFQLDKKIISKEIQEEIQVTLQKMQQNRRK